MISIPRNQFSADVIFDRPLLRTKPSYPFSLFREQYLRSHLYIQTLKFHGDFEGHGGCVNAINFNENGRLLVSGSDDATVKIWDVESRKCLHTLTGHTTNVFATNFIPYKNDAHVLSGGNDSEIRHFEITTNHCRVFHHHTKKVLRLSVNPQMPDAFLSCSSDGTVRQFDIRMPYAHASVQAPGRPSRGALDGDESDSDAETESGIIPQVFGGGRSSQHTSDRTTEALVLDFNGRAAQPGVFCVEFHPSDGYSFLVATEDGNVRLFDLRRIDHADPLTSSVNVYRNVDCSDPDVCEATGCAFSRDGAEVVVSTSHDRVYLYDTRRNYARELGVDYSADTAARHLASIRRNTNRVPLHDRAQRRHLSDSDVQIATVARYLVRHRFLQPRARARRATRLHAADALAAEAESAEMETEAEPDIEATAATAEDSATSVGSTDAMEVECPASPPRTGSPGSKRPRTSLSPLSPLSPPRPCGPEGSHHTPGSTPPEVAETVEFLRKHFGPRHPAAPTETPTEAADGAPDHHGAERDRGPATATESQAGPPSEGVSASESESESDEDTSGGDESSADRSGADSGDEDDEDEDEAAEEEKEEGAERDGHGFVGEKRKRRKRPRRTYVRRYDGHLNRETIKGVTFFGPQSEFIASGSDDASVFVWCKRTGRCLRVLKGHDSVVNCIAAHPYDGRLATSGIDDVVKLWAPSAPCRQYDGSAGPGMPRRDRRSREEILAGKCICRRPDSDAEGASNEYDAISERRRRLAQLGLALRISQRQRESHRGCECRCGCCDNNLPSPEALERRKTETDRICASNREAMAAELQERVRLATGERVAGGFATLPVILGEEGNPCATQ